MSGYDDTGSYGDRKRGVPAALVQGDGDANSTVEWETPESEFDAADAEFGPFTLDPATALGYHTSDVILARGGHVITLQGRFCGPALVHTTDRTGLDERWTGRVWLNHPYGRLDWRWMKKAHDSVRFGDAEIVVALVPVKTNMRWWHKYVLSETVVDPSSWDANATGMAGDIYTRKADRSRHEYGADVVRFIPRRLRFGGAPSSAPFNSAIVVWRK